MASRPTISSDLSRSIPAARATRPVDRRPTAQPERTWDTSRVELQLRASLGAETPVRRTTRQPTQSLVSAYEWGSGSDRIYGMAPQPRLVRSIHPAALRAEFEGFETSAFSVTVDKAWSQQRRSPLISMPGVQLQTLHSKSNVPIDRLRYQVVVDIADGLALRGELSAGGTLRLHLSGNAVLSDVNVKALFAKLEQMGEQTKTRVELSRNKQILCCADKETDFALEWVADARFVGV